MKNDEVDVISKKVKGVFLPSLKIAVIIIFALILKYFLLVIWISERSSKMGDTKQGVSSFLLGTEMIGSILFALIVVLIFQVGKKFRNKQSRYSLFAFGMFFSCVLTVNNLVA